MRKYKHSWLNDREITCYEPHDLEALYYIIKEAERIWYNDWIAMGRKDYGSCTLDKGFQIYYIPKRCRIPRLVNVVMAPPCQGNSSAYECHHRALEFLQEHMPEAKYNDGVMD